MRWIWYPSASRPDPEIGGHAAAASLTIRETDLGAFRQAFEQVCREWLDSSALEREIATDGELGSKEP